MDEQYEPPYLFPDYRAMALRAPQPEPVKLPDEWFHRAPGPCPFLAVRPFPCEPAGDPDVFPRRPADPSRPHRQLDPRSARARAPDVAIRPRDHDSGVGAWLSLGHRAAWQPCNPDGTLT